MATEKSEKEALSALLVDSTSYLTKLASLAQGIVGIDKTTGSTVYLTDTSKLTDEERVFIVILGRFFSNKLGKSTSDTCSRSEIAAESGLGEKTVSKRLSDLERNRFAENRERGKHGIVAANAEKMLMQIREKIKV
jgi:hypothetical protein